MIPADPQPPAPVSTTTSRRTLLKNSARLAATGAVASQLSISQSAWEAGSDEIKIGLVGCGGRGSGSAAQALKADDMTKQGRHGDTARIPAGGDADEPVQRHLAGSIHHHPAIAEVHFEHGMKVLRLQSVSVNGHVAGRKVEGSTEGNAEVGEIPTHPGARRKGFEGGGLLIIDRKLLFQGQNSSRLRPSGWMGCRFNLTMTGNNLDDHLGSALVIEKMMGSVVTGNMLEQSEGWGIIVDRDTYATTMTGNTLTNNKAGGIDLRDAHGCTISANTFSRTAQNALVVRKDSGRLTITGNTFTNGFVGEGTVLGNRGESPFGSGITLEDTQAISITGNTFTAVRPMALSVTGRVTHCLFANNLLVDCESEADQLLQSEVGRNVSMPADPTP